MKTQAISAGAVRRRAPAAMPSAASILVYVTCTSQRESLRIARTLVLEHLAACGNAIPGMRSVFRWQGRMRQAGESVLVLKTWRSLLARVTQRVRELHSYQLPCILALDVKGGDAGYLAWIARETASESLS